jgi:hypothetical protein
MGREHMQARLKELETEMSVLNWALDASLHEKDVDSDDEHSNPGSASTFTMANCPDSDAGGFAIPAQGHQAGFIAGSIAETESSPSLRSTKESVYSNASTMAGIQFSPTMDRIHQVIHSDPTGASYRYDGTGLSEDGREDEETIRGSDTGKGKEKEVLENTNATDPNSPPNITNPHPTSFRRLSSTAASPELPLSVPFSTANVLTARKPPSNGPRAFSLVNTPSGSGFPFLSLAPQLSLSQPILPRATLKSSA